MKTVVFDATSDKKNHNITYTKAKLYRRIFAKLIDLLVLVIIGIAIFFGARAIVQSTSYHQEVQARIDDIMLSSGLYIDVDGTNYDVINNISNDDTLSDRQKMESYIAVIEDDFLPFVLERNGEEDYQTVLEDYNSYRLSLDYQGIKMFITENDEIILNPSINLGGDTYNQYSNLCYIPYIDNHLKNYLTSLFPQYLEDTKYMSDMIVFVELPVAVIIAAFLTYFVPPLIFKRGRKTIGMLIYHIGLVDSRLLNVSLKRFTLFALSRIFLEIVLSFVTLAIPLLISISMMIITKTKQDFSEYILQVYEVDVTYEKIYLSREEVELEFINPEKKPVQFRNITGE